MTDQIDAANRVTLFVGNQEYSGWKSVRIGAGIERLVRDFSLEITGRMGNTSLVNLPRLITPGDLCQVYIGDELVVTGYVDATPTQYDAKRVSVGIRGRSKTADLVDCSPLPVQQSIQQSTSGWGDVAGPARAIRSPSGRSAAYKTPPVYQQAPAQTAGQWRNLKLETIAAALAAPYGVRVVAEVDTGRVISDHQVQIGETVFQSIDRMMRLRHVLSTDNGQGDLVFINVGSGGAATTAIELGVNVLSASADLDYKNVYSQYIVKGQRAGSDEAYAADVSEQQGQAIQNLSRARYLVIKQSGQADEGTCQDRADYELAYRAAKALQATYTVADWRQQDGSLWLPNQLVPVKDSVLGFDQSMLIADLEWVLDDNGRRTELHVGPPDGYKTKAAKTATKAKQGGGSNWGDVK